MKRKLIIGIGALFGVLFLWTLLVIWGRSGTEDIVIETETPFLEDIVQKTVATGSIQPRREIEIKSRVSGIVDEILVNSGDFIEQGTVIAKVRIIPNIVQLNEAESRVKRARINFEHSKRDRDRHEKLWKKQVISEKDLQNYRKLFHLKKTELQSAQNNLELIRRGSLQQPGTTAANLIRATLSGTVLAVPVKEGTSITESNTFNAGTTVAVVANMNDMIFVGTVDESEIGQIKEAMELNIRIAAINNKTFSGVLEQISPKGQKIQGVTRFEIKAALKDLQDLRVRAGYSATAEIVLDKREQVMVIHELFLQFDAGKPFVEVEISSGQFEKRPVTVGLSDGINIEILSGIEKTDRIKKPQTDVSSTKGYGT